MLRVYGDHNSGNCYKVKLLLTQLDIPFEWIDIDILKNQSRTPEFLAKNPNGKIPTLETEDGRYLPESNAILCYLSEATPLLPDDNWERAQVLRWLFFEQYSHEPYIATSRYIVRYLNTPLSHEHVLNEKRAPGYAALDVMEQHLQNNNYFVGDRYTIADISLYAYTHVADEGGFDLSAYRAIHIWLEQVRSQPKHVAMNDV